MGLAEKVSLPLSVETMIPAVGQGAIAVETREDEPVRERIRSLLDHPPTRAALEAERAFLAALGGGCQLPAAAHATVERERVVLRALIASPEAGPGGKPEVVQGEKAGPISAAARAGKELAEELLAKGGREILARLPAR
jgi:hydroxymethylbilane synthase